MPKPTTGLWQKSPRGKALHWTPSRHFPCKIRKTCKAILNISWSSSVKCWRQPLTPPGKIPRSVLIPWKMRWRLVSVRPRRISIPAQVWLEKWRSRFQALLTRIIPPWIPYRQILSTALSSFVGNIFPPTKTPWLPLMKRRIICFVSWRKAPTLRLHACSRTWMMNCSSFVASWNLNCSRWRMTPTPL